MRQGTQADAPEIARLIKTLWSDDNPDPAWIARVSLESNHVTLLELADDGRLIGFVDGFTTVARDGILRWEIDLLGVHPDQRGRGIAQNLVRASVKAGQQAGASITRALVRIDNRAAQTTFERCGFTTDETIRHLYISDHDLNDRAPVPPAAHLISVSTLTYSGIWVEGDLLPEALRAAQAIRTRYRWDVAGVILAEESFAHEQTHYHLVGRFRWLTL